MGHRTVVGVEQVPTSVEPLPVPAPLPGTDGAQLCRLCHSPGPLGMVTTDTGERYAACAPCISTLYQS